MAPNQTEHSRLELKIVIKFLVAYHVKFTQECVMFY